MPFDHIPALTAALAAAGLAELELTGPSSRLRLRLRLNASGQMVQDDASGNAEGVERDIATVFAPCVGVFQHGHPMRSEPLIAAGREIVAGQVIGLLRVGALLLPVTASVDGLVTAVLVPDGTVVGYGTALIVYEPAGYDDRGTDGH